MAEVHVQPFLFRAGRIGVLLIHGFTASPTEMWPLGRYLHQAGMTVLGVRLEGHGTDPEDLSRTNWQDWLTSAQAGLQELEKYCDRVFAAGLSMGGILAVILAARYPDRLCGLALLAPAFYLRTPFLPLAAGLRPLIRAIDKGAGTRAYLAQHHLFSYPVMPVPALMELHHLIRVGWHNLGQISLPDSDHILTTEPDAPCLFASVQHFISWHTSTPQNRHEKRE